MTTPESEPEPRQGAGPPAQPGSDADADTRPDRGVEESAGDAPEGTIPPQPSLLGSSEAMRPVERIDTPEGDRPE